MNNSTTYRGNDSENKKRVVFPYFISSDLQSRQMDGPMKKLC